MTEQCISDARQALIAFFAEGERLKYEPNQVIAGSKDEGDAALYIYYVVEGFVGVGCNKSDQYAHSMSELGVHSLFPIFRLTERTMMPVDMIAMSDVVCYRRTVDDVREFITSHPESFAWVIYGQLALAYERLFNFTLNSAEKRMAQRLLALGARYGRMVDDQVWINFPMKHQTLANSIHVSRETAGKILQGFEDRHLLVYGRKASVIWPDKLRTLLEETDA